MPPRTSVGLSELLVDYRTRTGESYADMARRTGISRGYFGYLINTEPPFRVRPETLERIHEGLAIPLDAVRQAAIVTAGLAEADELVLPDKVGVIIEKLVDLKDDQLDVVGTVVDTLRSQNDAGRGGGKA